MLESILNNYDFANPAECAQEFEGLMPKVAEKVGEIGDTVEERVLSIYEQGEGVDALKVADFMGLATASGSTDGSTGNPTNDTTQGGDPE